MEQQQPVVPEQFLAEGAERGRRRVVGQAAWQLCFSLGRFGGRGEGRTLLGTRPARRRVRPRPELGAWSHRVLVFRPEGSSLEGGFARRVGHHIERAPTAKNPAVAVALVRTVQGPTAPTGPGPGG